jgi:hypothetical protein
MKLATSGGLSHGVNLETLSTFALARMLSDCAEGSVLPARDQKELGAGSEQQR